MAQTLTNDIAVAFLVNAIATGCTLFFIITILGPVSGAHFNPVVTLAFAFKGKHSWPLTAAYIPVQILGGIAGVWLFHVMFEHDIMQFSATPRTEMNQWTSEIVATFSLLFFDELHIHSDTVPKLAAAYITGAYLLTSLSSFANPAVTIAWAFSDSFAGINPVHVFEFVLAQLVGLALALLVLPRLFAQQD
jgi:glycerol uptake facilitator-like aquaporin